MIFTAICLMYLVLLAQDKEPGFAGGERRLKCYMRDIAYPFEAIKQQTEGTVYIQFQINAEGQVQHAKVIEGVDSLIDSVALHHIQNMPPWKPGIRNGQPATYSMVIPISFGLQDLKDKRVEKSLRAFEEGKALYLAGAYKDALPHLIFALKMDPNYTEAYYIRGMCYYHLDIASPACMDLTKAHSMGYYDERSQRFQREMDCEKVLRVE